MDQIMYQMNRIAIINGTWYGVWEDDTELISYIENEVPEGVHVRVIEIRDISEIPADMKKLRDDLGEK
jgi:hypothetical protein